MVNLRHRIAMLSVVGLVALALAGCEMKSITLSPEMYGKLVVDGKPAINSQVYFGHVRDEGQACTTLPSTLTDAAGNFSFPAVQARVFATNEGEREAGMALLCFRYNGVVRPDTWADVEPSEKRIFDLRCRLPVPVDAIAEDRAVCQWQPRQTR